MASQGYNLQLASVACEHHERSHRSSQSRKSPVPRVNEVCIIQVLEDREDAVTKKLPRGFSRTECRILDALSKYNDYLPNPQVQVQSSTIPAKSQSVTVENQE